MKLFNVPISGMNNIDNVVILTDQEIRVIFDILILKQAILYFIYTCLMINFKNSTEKLCTYLLTRLYRFEK